MRKSFLAVMCLVLIVPAFGQHIQEKIDTTVIARIKDEGLNRPQVMEILSMLTDIYGPRLTWSPEYKEAAEWASTKLKEWGLQNVQYDRFAPVGKGWTLKGFQATVLSPRAFPLIGYPKAWSPGTKGTIRGRVVHLDVNSEEDLQSFRGKLRNAFVLTSEPRVLSAGFAPRATRREDSDLLSLANARPAEQERRRFRDSAAAALFCRACG